MSAPFDWGDSKRPEVPFNNLVIYEMTVSRDPLTPVPFGCASLALSSLGHALD